MRAYDTLPTYDMVKVGDKKMVYCDGLDIIIMLSLEYLLSSTLLSVSLISQNFGAFNQVNELIMTLFLENSAFSSIYTFILLLDKLLSIHPFNVPFLPLI